MVTYPLPATTIPPKLIYETQSTIMSLFLTRMGYPRHMLHSVVYTPAEIGRIGMWHLSHKQGMQQTLQILRHLQAKSTNGTLYTLTIDQYQIYMGIQQPILEQTKHIPWIPTGWITLIHEFLHVTNSRICLKEPWTPPQWCKQDQCIMDDALESAPPEHLETINSMQMYMQVFMLSKICKSNGTHIQASAIDRSATPSSSPLTGHTNPHLQRRCETYGPQW